MKKNSKSESLQESLGAFLTNMKPETSRPEQPQQARKETKATFSKHNLFFSDELFEKVKILCQRSGKTQREVLDVIIGKYVEEYERKHGELKADKIDL